MKHFVFFLFLLLGSVVPAKTIYTIGVEETNDDGYAMYFRELLDSFAQSKTYIFSFKSYPIARLTRSYINGEVDFKCPDNEEWARDLKRDKNISYSDTLADSVEGVLVKPANLSHGLSDIHSIGIPLGFTPVAFQELIKTEKVTLITNASLQGLIRQVIAGHIDGMYYNIKSAENILASMGKAGELVYNPKLAHVQTSYTISSLKHPQVIQEINRFMKADKPLIVKLKRKYKLE